MTLSILGMGTAVPTYFLTQERAAALAVESSGADARQAKILSAVYRKSGVSTRRSVLLAENDVPDRDGVFAGRNGNPAGGPTTLERMTCYRDHAPALAVQASEKAIAAAGIDAGQVSHLITVSCTGFAAPSIDVAVIRSLSLPRTVQRTHVGFMGCHGALNGLQVAHSIVQSDPEATVLLCAVELCSLHVQYGWDPDCLIANALFADGAAALVATSEVEKQERRGWNLRATGSCLIEGSEDVMQWHVGDHGFRMTLSARVPELIRSHLGGWLEEWLSGQGLRLGDVRSWAVHPGGPRVLDSVEAALELSQEDTRCSRDVLANHGNMSSPTLLFILGELRQRGARGPCVALGFGPGLVVEAALFD